MNNEYHHHLCLQFQWTCLILTKPSLYHLAQYNMLCIITWTGSVYCLCLSLIRILDHQRLHNLNSSLTVLLPCAVCRFWFKLSKQLSWLLLEPSFSRLGQDSACSVAGITSDANVLTAQLRLIAQRYEFTYQESIPTEQLVRTLCDVKQR